MSRFAVGRSGRGGFAELSNARCAFAGEKEANPEIESGGGESRLCIGYFAQARSRCWKIAISVEAHGVSELTRWSGVGRRRRRVLWRIEVR